MLPTPRWWRFKPDERLLLGWVDQNSDASGAIVVTHRTAKWEVLKCNSGKVTEFTRGNQYRVDWMPSDDIGVRLTLDSPKRLDGWTTSDLVYTFAAGKQDTL